MLYHGTYLWHLLLLHRSRHPKLRIYTVKRRFTLKMESGKLIISSSKHLKKFEGELFDAVMEYGYHVHIILIGHQCHDEKGYYDMFSTNLHPTIKCIYIPRSLIHDVRAINVVLRSNGHEGLEFSVQPALLAPLLTFRKLFLHWTYVPG